MAHVLLQCGVGRRKAVCGIRGYTNGSPTTWANAGRHLACVVRWLDTCVPVRPSLHGSLFSMALFQTRPFPVTAVLAQGSNSRSIPPARSSTHATGAPVVVTIRRLFPVRWVSSLFFSSSPPPPPLRCSFSQKRGTERTHPPCDRLWRSLSPPAAAGASTPEGRRRRSPSRHWTRSTARLGQFCGVAILLLPRSVFFFRIVSPAAAHHPGGATTPLPVPHPQRVYPRRMPPPNATRLPPSHNTAPPRRTRRGDETPRRHRVLAQDHHRSLAKGKRENSGRASGRRKGRR